MGWDPGRFAIACPGERFEPGRRNWCVGSCGHHPFFFISGRNPEAREEINVKGDDLESVVIYHVLLTPRCPFEHTTQFAGFFSISMNHGSNVCWW